MRGITSQYIAFSQFSLNPFVDVLEFWVHSTYQLFFFLTFTFAEVEKGAQNQGMLIMKYNSLIKIPWSAREIFFDQPVLAVVSLPLICLNKLMEKFLLLFMSNCAYV